MGRLHGDLCARRRSVAAEDRDRRWSVEDLSGGRSGLRGHVALDPVGAMKVQKRNVCFAFRCGGLPELIFAAGESQSLGAPAGRISSRPVLAATLLHRSMPWPTLPISRNLPNICAR